MSNTADTLLSELTSGPVKMGDLKKRAKAIKRDHDLALELWDSGNYHARLLAVLIFDKKQITPEMIDRLAADMEGHDEAERNQLTDWLLANQLTKDKNLLALLQTWADHPSPILRRLFWYHQARLRWTGQTPPDNSASLVDAAEERLATEHPDVQWAMNYCAGWIGVYQPELRARCVQLGESTGLYRDDPVARNCTPSYLPEFIRIEAEKRSL